MKNKMPLIYGILGSLFMILSNGKFLNPLAAWLFPIFFLLATQKGSLKKHIFWLVPVLGLSNQLSFNGMIPDLNSPVFTFMPAMAGTVYAIPYLMQQSFTRKNQGFLTTLILPTVYTLLDGLNVYFNPFGTFGVLGYSQYYFPGTIQWVAFVGVLGLTFIITWTASIVYWFYLNRENKKAKKIVTAFFIAITIFVVLGFFRASSPIKGKTVDVSGIHTLDRTEGTVLEIFNLHEENKSQAFIEKTEENMTKLIRLTEQEAQTGAKIIHHSEGVALIDVSQKEEYLDRLGAIAKKYQVYILTVPYIITEKEKPNENVLYIIDKKGNVALEHFKYGGNMIEHTKEGSKEIPYIDTEYGRFSGIICWDKDFPSVVDQVGENNSDILFIPSADWKEISPYHTLVGNVRGIENGSNVVTQTVNGMSMITDYRGNVLGQMDHFKTDEWILRGHVPTQGVKTFYSVIGKYFMIFNLVLLLGVMLILRKQK